MYLARIPLGLLTALVWTIDADYIIAFFLGLSSGASRTYARTREVAVVIMGSSIPSQLFYASCQG